MVQADALISSHLRISCMLVALHFVSGLQPDPDKCEHACIVPRQPRGPGNLAKWDS